jgi:hypothetical protein
MSSLPFFYTVEAMEAQFGAEPARGAPDPPGPGQNDPDSALQRTTKLPLCSNGIERNQP